MKKSILFVFAALFAASTMAQTSDSSLRVWENNVVTYQAPVDNIDSITFVSKSEIGETLIGDLITDITPIIEDEVEVGYTMSFLHHDPINIYHGKKGDKGDKGEQGDSMLQSITQDEDSVYFTLANGSVVALQKTPNKPKDFEQTIIDNLVTSIKLDKNEVYLTLNSSETLNATTNPFDNSRVYWTSSNPSVVSVENGNIVANSYGDAIITASAGDKSSNCHVYVVARSNQRRFKLSNSKYIYFSPSNLLYQPSTNSWAFSEYQYVVNDKAYTGETDSEWYGRFGFPGYTNRTEIINWEGNQNWRLATSEDWDNIRANNTSHVITLLGIKGIIILPVNYQGPEVIDGQSISIIEWTEMENNGAIFLTVRGSQYTYYYLSYNPNVAGQHYDYKPLSISGNAWGWGSASSMNYYSNNQDWAGFIRLIMDL